VLFGLVSYCTTTVDNPITGKSSAALATAGGGAGTTGAIRNGGSVWRSHPDNLLQQYVDQVGPGVQKSVVKSAPSFEFHLLRDPQTVNAFALPGGQVFLTAGLLRRLSSEAQLAAVLGHEVGHVVGRHAA